MSFEDTLRDGTLRWTQATAGGWPRSSANSFTPFQPENVVAVCGAFHFWDSWPLLTDNGNLFDAGSGTELWFALAAPISVLPDDRHSVARIHLLEWRDGVFRTLGPAIPDGLSPGSREWSGCATIESNQRVTLMFTAAGYRGAQTAGYEQRLFRAFARLANGALTEWSAADEFIVADGVEYQLANQPTGQPGRIKAFRDPDYFRDPANGSEWVVFTGSSARLPGTYDGVIGLARLDGNARTTLFPPLIDATGFNNELERPHLRCFDGKYYVFWTTQAYVFAEPDTAGPTGLYGAVANSATGCWELLNGNGLVAANPPEEPGQAYSWLVLPDRRVTSFVDQWGIRSADGARFGGTFAPFASLRITGSRAIVRHD